MERRRGFANLVGTAMAIAWVQLVDQALALGSGLTPTPRYGCRSAVAARPSKASSSRQ